VFVPLVVRHAKRTHLIILPSMACPVLKYFHTLPENSAIFGGKIIEHKMSVSIFSTVLSDTFPILRRIQRDTITNVKWPLLLSDFNENFLHMFGKYSNVKFQ